MESLYGDFVITGDKAVVSQNVAAIAIKNISTNTVYHALYCLENGPSLTLHPLCLGLRHVEFEA